MTKKVYLASDHAGFDLKEALIPFLKERGYEVEDLGPFTIDPNDDYSDTIIPLALAINKDKEAMGIAVGASGEGEAIVCNRLHGVRAAVYYGPAAHAQTDASGQSLDIIASSRVHGNANVLSLGARFMTQEHAKMAVERRLTTEFSNEERHVRRIQKLN